MTSEQLREIERRFVCRSDLAQDRQLIFSEVRRLRHQCMECECFGKKPTPCEYAKNGHGMTVDERKD